MTDKFSNNRPYQCVKDGTGEKIFPLQPNDMKKESIFYIATSRIQNEMHMMSLYKSDAIFFFIILECVFLINKPSAS